MAYGILETDRPEITVRRHSSGLEVETFAGIEAELVLPEIGVTMPLAAVYVR